MTWVLLPLPPWRIAPAWPYVITLAASTTHTDSHLPWLDSAGLCLLQERERKEGDRQQRLQARKAEEGRRAGLGAEARAMRLAAVRSSPVIPTKLAVYVGLGFTMQLVAVWGALVLPAWLAECCGWSMCLAALCNAVHVGGWQPTLQNAVALLKAAAIHPRAEYDEATPLATQHNSCKIPAFLAEHDVRVGGARWSCSGAWLAARSGSLSSI